MEISWGRALWRNFLGQSPDWYKLALIIFLIVNPLIFLISPFVAGWLLVAEFIFTLAMALKCYPLLPGGLLAIEAVFIGMTSAEFCEALLHSKRVAVVPGDAFGACGEGFLRISYAYSLDNLKMALERLEHFIAHLREEKKNG